MNTKFSNADLKQIADLGLTQEAVAAQIENFRKGFPKTELIDAATVENGGIMRMDDNAINHYVSSYKQASAGKKILKFVPASGAATRMFKDLYSFTATSTTTSRRSTLPLNNSSRKSVPSPSSTTSSLAWKSTMQISATTWTAETSPLSSTFS